MAQSHVVSLMVYILLTFVSKSFCVLLGANNSKPSCISFVRANSTHSNRPKPKSSIICLKNDTYCGDWLNKKWNPVGCKYREFSSEDARKCLANRTIGCIGDSQMRHFCGGLVYLLYDLKLEETFVDPATNRRLYDFIPGEMFANVDEVMFQSNYRAVAPKKSHQKSNDFSWQVQLWTIFNQTLTNRHIHEMFQNKYLNANNLPSAANITKLKPIDFALWNIGIHDPIHFSKEPMGENYYNFFVKQWIESKDTAKFPVVWMSMNTNCYEKKRRDHKHQVKMVDEANYYMHKRLKAEGLPYFDATSVLRTTEDQKCNASRDGMHVHNWVDLERAQILLNHLCDENNNWVEGVDSFL